MAQYATPSDRHVDVVEPIEGSAPLTVANPLPLGLGALAFTTAIIGCSYAGFIIPSIRTGTTLVVAFALFYGGLVQILAGMWEFKRENTFAATLFSSYGGFLVAFGIIFMPGSSISSALNISTVDFHQAIGLLFLCWTIFTGVLFIGSLRSSGALALTMILLFIAFLFLTIGTFAGSNGVLLAIGGWFGVATAIVGWYAALGGLLRSINSPITLPMGLIRMR
ncbi:MAG TPA: acetate uptake transporter [Ktedonobacteraceae bacterium]|nr:acetate uptake transporter [Ktedonobacteraceae bacterium]